MAGRGYGSGGHDGMNGMIPMAIIREMGQSAPSQVQGAHGDVPPVRTLLAKQFLEYLTEKQVKRPIPESVDSTGRQEFKILDGQKPTTEEEAAGVAAANVLEHYFKGDLQMNDWEKADMVLAPTAEMQCVCTLDGGQPQRLCPFCGGRGKMLLVLDPTKIQQQPLAGKLKRVPHPELSTETINSSGKTSRG